MRQLFPVGALGLLAAAAPLFAGSYRVDVTVVSGNSTFSSPLLTFTNLSDAGYQIVQTDFAGAFSDYVLNRIDVPIAAPAGGSYTAIAGTQVSSVDQNEGCDPQTFTLTGFDTGETFAYVFDPEPNNCSSAVFDFSTRLDANAVTATVGFSGPGLTGTTFLTGNTWTKELINPQLPSSNTNDLYRLTLSDATSVPEPSTISLLLGALLATGIRVRRLRRP